MSDIAIKMMVSISPILIYSISHILTNWRINSILTNKVNRKKYKRYFNKMLATFFSPFFLLSVVLLMFFFPEKEFVIFGIIMLVLKSLTVLMSGALSFLLYKELKREMFKLIMKASADDLLKSASEDLP
jgi:uncharacterized membrane protein